MGERLSYDKRKRRDKALVRLAKSGYDRIFWTRLSVIISQEITRAKDDEWIDQLQSMKEMVEDGLRVSQLRIRDVEIAYGKTDIKRAKEKQKNKE